MLGFAERALTAFEKIADSLSILARVAASEPETPDPGTSGRSVVLESPVDPDATGATTEETPLATEQQSTGRTRVSKAKREAARDAVLAAGLDLAKLEKEWNTNWPNWSGAQCDKAVSMAADMRVASEPTKAEASVDSAKAEVRAEPATGAFATQPPSAYSAERAALLDAMKVATSRKGESYVNGVLAAVAGSSHVNHIDPAKYAGVTAALLAACAEPAAAEPQALAATESSATAAPKTEAKPVTLEQVRALAQQLSAKSNDKQPARDIIQQVAGTAKLTEVPKEKFGELYAAFAAVLGMQEAA